MAGLFYIDFLYDANGTKLRKTVSTGVQQDYLGGIEYTNGAIDAIYHEEGRATPSGTSWQYEYYLKDHLGNTRVIFTDSDNNGEPEIIQEADYYPFGMRHDRSVTATNHYLYNGKELNEDLGLDWYDYGFRWYDAELGRFPSVDPIIENFPWVTPYNYAENEPVGHVDLWGLQKGKPPMYQKVFDTQREWRCQTTFDITQAATNNNFWKEAKRAPIFDIGFVYEDAVIRSYGFPLKQQNIKVPPNSTSTKRSVRPDAITYSIALIATPNMGLVKVRGVNGKIIDAKFSADISQKENNIQQAYAYIDILAEAKGLYVGELYYPNAKLSDYGMAVLEYVTPANSLLIETEINSIISYATSRGVVVRQRYTEVEIGYLERIRIADGLDLNAVFPRKTLNQLVRTNWQISPFLRSPLTFDKRPSVEFNWDKYRKK